MSVGDEFDAAMRRLTDRMNLTPEEIERVEQYVYSAPDDEPPTRHDQCPHGAPWCPCGNPEAVASLPYANLSMRGGRCLYEGPDAHECAHPTLELMRAAVARYPVNLAQPHCHVEGCGWVHDGDCGLAKIGADPVHSIPEDAVTMLDVLRGGPWWACGASRELAATIGRIPR